MPSKIGNNIKVQIKLMHQEGKSILQIKQSLRKYEDISVSSIRRIVSCKDACTASKSAPRVMPQKFDYAITQFIDAFTTQNQDASARKVQYEVFRKFGELL